MANISKGVSDAARKALNYEGFQAKDWVDQLLKERGIMQTDIANMLGVATVTVSRWTTGVSFPNTSSAKSLVLAIAPHYSLEEERRKFIDEQMAVYDSIRKSYLESLKERG